MSEHIVIGYDGTEGSRAALNEAVGLSKKLDAELVLAFAYEPPSPEGGELKDLRDTLHELGERRLSEGEATAQNAGIQTRTVLVDDRPADGLAALAEEIGASMIIVGSYGRKPLRSAIVGSTPHKLLHLTHIPVLVVRADNP
jgi:nucleotide-binding universal stress UspA family protein